MRRFSIALVCILLLAFALAGAVAFVKTAPKAERKQPPRIAALVEVEPLRKTDETVVLHLTGSVEPAQEVLLRARVGGEVVEMDPDFVEGGLLEAGDEILRIDPVDYELALAAAKSALETARFNHKLELGRQDVAQREWELLKTPDASEQERELALRVPHLAASKAALVAAEARVRESELDLERTRVVAPFNAVVLERNADLGSQVLLQDALARLAGTDAYWVVATIPVDRLEWVVVPGSRARIVSNGGAEREGRVIKLLGDLEEKGRMARLLVEVKDPFCIRPENQGKKPLLIGEYVQAEIDGRRLEEVFSIPRKALRENSRIWIAKDGKLDIRDVEVLWRDARQVLVRDHLDEGELLVVSDLTTPIQGMDLNTGEKPAEKE